jgi:transposase
MDLNPIENLFLILEITAKNTFSNDAEYPFLHLKAKAGLEITF